MKTNYDGFRGWLNYIRDYKDNKDNDLISEQRLIDVNNERIMLLKKIAQLEEYGKEKDHAMQLSENRIQTLNQKYSELKKNEKQLIINLAKEQDKNQKLQDKLEITEKRRRANATTIGAKNRKIRNLLKQIQELKLELAKKDHAINFLKSSKHAPSKEEIIAYETQMKEVEKRIKNK